MGCGTKKTNSGYKKQANIKKNAGTPKAVRSTGENRSRQRGKKKEA